MRPVCLIIRDGWGYSENPEGNAVLAAKTPNCGRYKSAYSWTLLDCSGEPVGLPDGYQGSSEVEHLNMGAGRIVIQELKRIDAHVLITADHGNSEQMIDYETRMTKISHTLNPVDFVYVAQDSKGRALVERGKLSDIAPTGLYLMGLEIPEEMTARNLIVNHLHNKEIMPGKRAL